LLVADVLNLAKFFRFQCSLEKCESSLTKAPSL
jgi:hypothetical protein